MHPKYQIKLICFDGPSGGYILKWLIYWHFRSGNRLGVELYRLVRYLRGIWGVHREPPRNLSVGRVLIGERAVSDLGIRIRISNRGSWSGRKLHSERGAPADLAPDLDRAAVALHDAQAH